MGVYDTHRCPHTLRYSIRNPSTNHRQSVFQLAPYKPQALNSLNLKSPSRHPGARSGAGAEAASNSLPSAALAPQWFSVEAAAEAGGVLSRRYVAAFTKNLHDQKL